MRPHHRGAGARPARLSSCIPRCAAGCTPGNAACRSTGSGGGAEPGVLRRRSAWLDVHRDLIELQIIAEAIFDLIGNAVRACYVGVAIYRDGELRELMIPGPARADRVC